MAPQPVWKPRSGLEPRLALLVVDRQKGKERLLYSHLFAWWVPGTSPSLLRVLTRFSREEPPLGSLGLSSPDRWLDARTHFSFFLLGGLKSLVWRHSQEMQLSFERAVGSRPLSQHAGEEEGHTSQTGKQWRAEYRCDYSQLLQEWISVSSLTSGPLTYHVCDCLLYRCLYINKWGSSLLE